MYVSILTGDHEVLVLRASVCRHEPAGSNHRSACVALPTKKKRTVIDNAKCCRKRGLANDQPLTRPFEAFFTGTMHPTKDPE